MHWPFTALCGCVGVIGVVSVLNCFRIVARGPTFECWFLASSSVVVIFVASR